MRAMVDGHFGFVAFDVGVGSAKRKTDQSDDLDLGILQQRVSKLDARSVDGYAVESVFARLGAQSRNVLAPCCGLDEGMIDAARQFKARERFHFGSKSITKAFSSFNSLIVASIFDRLNSLMGSSWTT